MATLTAVLCNYNHGATVGRAIRAMATQSRPPDELIVVDDGSTDNSVAAIEPYTVRFPFVRLIRSPKNLGIHAAMRVAVAAARGDYLYAGAADDEVLPGFFQRTMDLAGRWPDAGILFGDFRAVTSTGKRLAVHRWDGWPVRHLSPAEFVAEALPRWVVTSFSSATVFRTAAFREVGGYRDDLRSFTDTFATWAVALKYGAAYAPGLCAKFFVNPGSLGNAELRDPEALRAIVRRAAELMRDPEFRDRFPADFVDGWERTAARAAQAVPLDMDAVRDAFVEVVGWNSPLLKVLALYVGFVTKPRPAPAAPPAGGPSIAKHPLELASAFVRLATWRRPGMKSAALLMAVALRVAAWRGLVRR